MIVFEFLNFKPWSKPQSSATFISTPEAFKRLLVEALYREGVVMIIRLYKWYL